MLIAETPGRIVRLEKKLQFPPFQVVFARVGAVRVIPSRKRTAIAELLALLPFLQIVGNLDTIREVLPR
jgi:hypothetical protein